MLGDLEKTELGTGKREAGEKNGASKVNGKMNLGSLRQKDFIHFRFGEEEDRLESETRSKSGFNQSKAIAERASILAKLESIKEAKKREKLAQRGLLAPNSGTVDGEGKDKGDGGGQEEVVILWKHILRGRAETRASISKEERRRLEGIYREFVVGRNGEMPSGQGGTEVGAGAA